LREIDIKELKKYCNPSYLTIRRDRIIVNSRRLAELSKAKKEKIERKFKIPVIYSKSYELISQKMGRYVSKHGIITPKDRLIVGLSGGKDSLALLHLLEPYRRRFGVKIYAVTVDINVGGIRPWHPENSNVKKIVEHCEALNIPHRIISFHEDVVKMSQLLSDNSTGIVYSPCFSCSIVRRYVLTNFAMELVEKEGVERDKIKICLGHTLEDNSDTILANIFKGDIIRVLEPIKDFEEAVFDFKEFKLKLQRCTIARPLLSVSEKDILKALNECDIQYYRDKEICPYSRDRGDSIRKRCHEILENLEKDVKNIREMVVSSVLKSIEYYRDKDKNSIHR